MSSFPGEAFLEGNILPDSFDQAAFRVSIFLTLAFTLWCILIPLMGVLAMQEEMEERLEQLEQQQEEQQELKESDVVAAGSRRGKTAKRSSSDDAATDSPFQANDFNKTHKPNNSNQQPQISSLSTNDLIYMAMFTLNGLFWSTLIILLWISPYNSVLGRGVLQIHGILSPTECTQFLEKIHAAAQRNVDAVENSDDMDDPFGYLDAPQGFAKRNRKVLSSNGVLADLDLLDTEDTTAPSFMDADRQWLTETLLDTRLAPTLERVWGIPSDSSMQLQEFYVEHYQAGTQRTERTMLFKHASSSQPAIAQDHDLIFRIELTDNPQGGSYLPTTATTHYWNTFSQTFFTATDDDNDNNNKHMAGTMVLHNNRLATKEGPALVSGQRTMLVGTIAFEANKDNNDSSSRLSPLTTYTNFPWVVTRLEQFIQQQFVDYGKVTKFAFFAQLLRDFLEVAVSQTWMKHKVYTLVQSQNGQAFRDALDQATDEQEQEVNNHWWWGHRHIESLSSPLTKNEESSMQNEL